MNLNGQNPDLASKLNSFARRFDIQLNTMSPPNKINKLIVLGDGTPDDITIFLVSHHLNGTETVGIVKPIEGTGTSTFLLVPSYLSANKMLKVILFVLDQENEPLDSISEKFEKVIKKSVNYEFQCLQASDEGRVKLYQSIYGARELSLILVINGLSAIATEQHMIEDHFLKLGSELGLLNLPNTIPNPKDYWHNAEKTTREAILQKLVRSKKTLELTFPQQIKGCGLLKDRN
jgi:hypothetical protein